MRIVQYRSGDETGCGVELGGAVFATGYADTLSLIRDGERGLEAAAAAGAAGGEPVQVDRLLAPLTNPGKIFGSGVNYAQPRRRGAWASSSRTRSSGTSSSSRARSSARATRS